MVELILHPLALVESSCRQFPHFLLVYKCSIHKTQQQTLIDATLFRHLFEVEIVRLTRELRHSGVGWLFCRD